MATSKQIDVNVISRNGANGNNKLVALTINGIVAVYKDGSDVTTITYQPTDDLQTSLLPARYKVPETLNAILVKANAADSNNGLITVTVTKANGITLSTPKAQIINRVKVQAMTAITGGGTRIQYGHKRQSVLEVSENLVVSTPST